MMMGNPSRRRTAFVGLAFFAVAMAATAPGRAEDASRTLAPRAGGYPWIGIDPNRPINPATGAIEINRQVVADTGTQVVRLNFILGPWSSPGDTTKHSGRTFFETYDLIVNDLIARDVTVYALVGGEAVHSDAALLDSQDYMDDYTASFVPIVEHFRDRIRHYESFNEPNNWAPGTSTATIQPYWFARMLEQVYMAVKHDNGHAGDPTWQVNLITGPLFTHDIGGGDTSGGDTGREYFAATAQAGITQLNWEAVRTATGSYPYDGIGMHIYVKQGETNATPIRTRINYNMDQLWTAATSIEGAQTQKKIWITEIGWQSVNEISEAQQAANMQTAFDLLLDDSRVALITWFCLHDFPGANYGIFRIAGLGDGDKKTSWATFHNISTSNVQPTPTPSATATASPSPTDAPFGENLVFNGDFEHGFTAGGVGNGWTTWASGWSAAVAFVDSTSPVHGDSHAQRWGRADGTACHGGIYQRVTVQSGETYAIEAWLRREGDASDTWMEFGYDLTGGTDAEPGDARVHYTKLESQGAGAWIHYQTQVVATNSAITLFAKGGHSAAASGAQWFWVDDISLARLDPNATPTVTATAAPSPTASVTATALPSPTPAGSAWMITGDNP